MTAYIRVNEMKWNKSLVIVPQHFDSHFDCDFVSFKLHIAFNDTTVIPTYNPGAGCSKDD